MAAAGIYKTCATGDVKVQALSIGWLNPAPETD